MPHCPLEFIFGHMQLRADALRVRFVRKRQQTVPLVNLREQELRVLSDLQISLFPDGEIELSVGSDRQNPRTDPAADFQIPHQLLFGNEPGIPVIHGDKGSEIRTGLIDGSFDLIARAVRTVRLQIRIHIHGRAQAAALVDIDGHKALLPLLDPLLRLFMEGQQKILVQTPVQKRADPGDLHRRQPADLMQRQLRLLAGRDRTILRILV